MKVLRVLEKMEDDGGMRVDILINFGPVGKVNRLGGVTHLSIIIISHFNLITFT